MKETLKKYWSYVVIIVLLSIVLFGGYFAGELRKTVKLREERIKEYQDSIDVKTKIIKDIIESIKQDVKIADSTDKSSKQRVIIIYNDEKKMNE